jgi:imidazolonepropionase-like amidohydrolase
MPGLIDIQSRLFVIDRELSESGRIVPELSILDAIDPYIKEHREVLAHGVTAVHIAPGSRGLIGGRSAVLKVNGGRILKPNVVVKAAIGVSSGNVSSSLSRLEDYASIREALLAAKLYMRRKAKSQRAFVEYRQKKAEYDKLEDAKKDPKKKPKRPSRFRESPSQEVLSAVLAKRIPLLVEAHRTTDIMNALRLADEFALSLILEKCTEGYLVAGEIAKRKVPVIVGPVSTSFVDMTRLEYRKHDLRNAGILAGNGVKVALGVAGRDGASSKFVTLAAAMAVANGMDESAALRAITLTPAEMLGVAGRIGSLEAGKDADVVILSGPPLETRSSVEMVLIDGRIVYERKASQ